jgi:hypothetical protein
LLVGEDFAVRAFLVTLGLRLGISGMASNAKALEADPILPLLEASQTSSNFVANCESVFVLDSFVIKVHSRGRGPGSSTRH